MLDRGRRFPYGVRNSVANGREAEAADAVAEALRLYETKGNVAAAARLRLTASTDGA